MTEDFVVGVARATMMRGSEMRLDLCSVDYRFVISEPILKFDKMQISRLLLFGLHTFKI